MSQDTDFHAYAFPLEPIQGPVSRKTSNSRQNRQDEESHVRLRFSKCLEHHTQFSKNTASRIQKGNLSQRSQRRAHADVQSQAETAMYHNTNTSESNQTRLSEPLLDNFEAEPTSPSQSELSPGFYEQQPNTRPISHEQLVVEVKGIYAGLVLVEAKCIDIEKRQSVAAADQERGNPERMHLRGDQWQALTALHKQLLHEHHDFFLASQHPSASPALSRLAAKYSMPARMWRHGIHAFLEVLRHSLPDSLEHMLAFIYIAYSMMALLYETVPAFEDTWIECLGDLGRYRMAIEDDEPRDREVWSNVARFWYQKAANKSPNIGRLYHHLAILARPYTLEQLSLYTRSLTCITPFESAKGSIMTLFNPILTREKPATRRSFEASFIRAHGILFTRGLADPTDRFKDIIEELEADDSFESYVIKAATRFKEFGVFTAIANIAAIFGYGVSIETVSMKAHGMLFSNAFDGEEKRILTPLNHYLHTNGNIELLCSMLHTLLIFIHGKFHSIRNRFNATAFKSEVNALFGQLVHYTTMLQFWKHLSKNTLWVYCRQNTRSEDNECDISLASNTPPPRDRRLPVNVSVTPVCLPSSVCEAWLTDG